jgi:hypothetical protein
MARGKETGDGRMLPLVVGARGKAGREVMILREIGRDCTTGKSGAKDERGRETKTSTATLFIHSPHTQYTIVPPSPFSEASKWACASSTASLEARPEAPVVKAHAALRVGAFGLGFRCEGKNARMIATQCRARAGGNLKGATRLFRELVGKEGPTTTIRRLPLLGW